MSTEKVVRLNDITVGWIQDHIQEVVQRYRADDDFESWLARGVTSAMANAENEVHQKHYSMAEYWTRRKDIMLEVANEYRRFSHRPAESVCPKCGSDLGQVLENGQLIIYCTNALCDYEQWVGGLCSQEERVEVDRHGH